MAFGWHLLPQLGGTSGGSSCLAAQHGGNCCKAKAWAGEGPWGHLGSLFCCP